MKKVLVIVAALALTLGVAQAQDKVTKKAEVVEAKTEVAADKAALQVNKAARKDAKMRGDKEGLKAARKERMKQEGELVKDQAKKDVKVVKEKL